MKSVLKLIEDGFSIKEIKEKIEKNKCEVISPFEQQEKFKNKSLYEHLNKYAKYKKWELEDFIKAKAIELNGRDSDGYTLMQRLIKNEDINSIKMMLIHGIKLITEDYNCAKGKIKEFFDYQPGKEEPSIFEYCSNKKGEKDYKDKVKAIIYDQAYTTDSDSSIAEELSVEELSTDEAEEYDELVKKNLKKDNQSSLRLVAARGVHFAPKYFERQAIEQVKYTVDQKHPTFSQSTLFDADEEYTPADDIKETDEKIQERHIYNMAFIKKLKNSEDHKEKKIKEKLPCKTRNKQEFESLYYRFIQVYINSYSHLFNDGAIKIDFGFDTKNNPLISASWDFSKAAMYASDYRFDWKKRKLRKNPHYRRFTGAAKHPNMGYLDVYAFDVEYVRKHAFDRQLMCKDEYIKLSAFYRSEAEIIFHSIIPEVYHKGRFMVSLPSFDIKYSEKTENRFNQYGIATEKHYKEMKNKILLLPANKKSDEYEEVVNSITEMAANSQAALIEKTTHCRLFRAKLPKTVVYDHGDKLKSRLFKLK